LARRQIGRGGGGAAVIAIVGDPLKQVPIEKIPIGYGLIETEIEITATKINHVLPGHPDRPDAF
jgi:hypothetical protein